MRLRLLLLELCTASAGFAFQRRLNSIVNAGVQLTASGLGWELIQLWMEKWSWFLTGLESCKTMGVQRPEIWEPSDLGMSPPKHTHTAGFGNSHSSHTGSLNRRSLHIATKAKCSCSETIMSAFEWFRISRWQTIQFVGSITLANSLWCKWRKRAQDRMICWGQQRVFRLWIWPSNAFEWAFLISLAKWGRAPSGNVFWFGPKYCDSSGLTYMYSRNQAWEFWSRGYLTLMVKTNCNFWAPLSFLSLQWFMWCRKVGDKSPQKRRVDIILTTYNSDNISRQMNAGCKYSVPYAAFCGLYFHIIELCVNIAFHNYAFFLGAGWLLSQVNAIRWCLPRLRMNLLTEILFQGRVEKIQLIFRT